MKTLAALVAVIVIVTGVYFGGFAYDAYFVAPGPAAVDKILIVEPGDNAAEVGRALEEGEVVKSAFAFKLYAKLSGQGKNIQAGTFNLKTGMSYAAIFDALADAKDAEVEVTIPEGYTLKQIGVAVRGAIPSITEEEWNAAVGIDSPFEGHSFVIDAEKPDDLDLEGYLFPDTYRFFTNATAEDVVKKMLDHMAERWHEVCSTNCLPTDNMGTDPRATVHDALTLASIVEREVRGDEDMGLVADLFIRRWQIDMALQADSTVNYITGGDDPSVSYADLQIDSPYNTYMYKGLPPGPISNPGLSAIKAVIHPTSNNWYYFLTGERGRVYYAETFDEHIANKQKYLD